MVHLSASNGVYGGGRGAAQGNPPTAGQYHGATQIVLFLGSNVSVRNTLQIYNRHLKVMVLHTCVRMVRVSNIFCYNNDFISDV